MEQFERVLEKVEQRESAKVSDELGIAHKDGCEPDDDFSTGVLMEENPHAWDIMPRLERGRYGDQTVPSIVMRKLGHAAAGGIDRLLNLKGRGFDQ